jgi:dUTPase
MKILVQDVEGLKLPEQANKGEDAAYDIFATTAPMIHGSKIERPIDGMPMWSRVTFIEYGTNLFVAPQDDVTYDYSNVTDGGGETPAQTITRYHTELFPRSSLSKYNLVLANSVATIDGGYRNQIFLRFKYLFQPEDFVVLQEDVIRVYGMVRNEHLYQQGDKIIQVKARIDIPITFEKVKTLPPSQRNLGGFGSSGK